MARRLCCMLVAVLAGPLLITPTPVGAESGHLFRDRVSLLAVPYLTTIAAGDVDNDGRDDIVAADSYGWVHIWLQRADGTIGPVWSTQAFTGSAASLDIGDVSADGRDDIVIGSTGRVTVLTQLDGREFAKTSIPVANGSGYVQIGDLVAGDTPDIVTGTTYGPAIIHGGETPPAITWTRGVGVARVAVVDLDRDGRLDIVGLDASPAELGVTAFIADSTEASGFHPGVRRAASEGLPPEPPAPAATKHRPVALATADFDHDGAIGAVVVWDDTADNATPSGVTTMAWGVDGWGTPSHWVTDGLNPMDAVVADADGDDGDDLILNCHTSLQVATSESEALGPLTGYPSSSVTGQALAVGDLNGDGLLDVVSRSAYGYINIAYHVDPPAPAPGTLSGTVTESASGAPLAGAWVAALRTTDFSFAGGAAANGSGDYSVELPAGSYSLYVIDPTGAHDSGFFGLPTTVTVAAGTTTDADPTLTATLGSVTGTVVEDGTNAPFAGAWAIAINASTGSPEIATVADGSGQFTLSGLNAGSHLIVYADPTGGHRSEFSVDSSDAAGATPVAVTSGGSVTANDAMATQDATAAGAPLSGTVTETGTDRPLAGVGVMALHGADYRLARASFTDASGSYALDVAGGDYKLVFLDTAGRHDTEWYDSQRYGDIATAASVTAPTSTDVELDPNTGTMAGSITDDPADTPLAGAWVIAIGPAGIAGGATTAADGTYTIAGLAPGTYRAAFIDPTGSHLLEYYTNAAGHAGATPFNIDAATTTAIDAALTHP